MMQISISGQRLMAAALLLFAVAVSLLQILILCAHPPVIATSDHITVLTKRFEPLRGALPVRGEVGFATDVASGDSPIGSIYQARYVLAPLVLLDDANLPYVIGNFHSPVTAHKFLAGKDFAFVQDFGNGLLLLKKGP